MSEKILITGALGQIGSELTFQLRKELGETAVVASDVRMPSDLRLRDGGPFEFLDVLNPNQITRLFQIYKIKTIYHLAALLSATGETKPTLAWDLNMNGLYNMLEAARQYKAAIFFPSSIGAFGPSTPKDPTPQDTVMRPTTMYGITKAAGEMLCDYYHSKFGVDSRGLRFPGLISHQTEPGGGTTDYAVDIFFQAVKHRKYTCYLKPETKLDMMYMPDAIAAMVQIMRADGTKLKHRNAFNITAMSACPKDFALEIKKRIPSFEIDYKIDPIRQEIADSWPDHMDDTCAREEWGWRPKFDLVATSQEMLNAIQKKEG